MRNFISALITVSVIFAYSVQCFAISTLTYFDTVVLDAQSEISREAVIHQVVSSAKNGTEGITTLVYTRENQTSQSVFSSLKEIMSGATQSFFQK